MKRRHRLFWRKDMNGRLLVAAMAVLALMCSDASRPAQAQPYPDREVRLVLGFPPGGGIDVLGRLTAEFLSRPLGQRVIVENLPGANAVRAARSVAAAKPDGYALLFGSTDMAVNLHGLKEPGYALDDFAVIGGVSYSPLVLLVSTVSSKARSLNEMVAFGKANPGKLTFATNGPQSVNNLMARRLDAASGIAWREIPYKGSAQIMQDMLAGNVDAFFGLPSSGISIMGRPGMAVFGVSDDRRMDSLSDVPTFAEQGYPAVDDITVSSVYVPAATPQPIVEKLRAALAEVRRSADFKERLEKAGSLIYPGTPEEFASRIRRTADRYGAEFRKLGIEPQ
jgi:tripartite-type tricarboxylate transporter receptor subunit TctC